MPKARKPKRQSREKRPAKGHREFFSDMARTVSQASGQPLTFFIAISIIIIWAVTGPLFNFNDTWQLVINTGTTIITFLMVFLIQNTQNRDSEAMQLKLDEIIIALSTAHNQVISLEDKSQEELDEIKKTYLQLAKDASEQLETNQEKKAS